jgi:hypothetical protein
MSILNNENIVNKTIPESIADNLKDLTKKTFQDVVNSFNYATNSFWNNPLATPENIAECLGSDAKEMFLLHYALGQFINSIKPGIINESLSLIGQFTINEDNTVTIIND